MGTFWLTPERRGGRGLSQRPGRRKELAKQARKERKKESKAICCRSLGKKACQEAPTLEDTQSSPTKRREKKGKENRKPTAQRAERPGALGAGVGEEAWRLADQEGPQ